MKSPHRTHHDRIEPASATIHQGPYNYTLTVHFTFDPWDVPAAYPVAYAGDAFAAFQRVWDAGIQTLELQQDNHP